MRIGPHKILAIVFLWGLGHRLDECAGLYDKGRRGDEGGVNKEREEERGRGMNEYGGRREISEDT